MTVEIKRGEVVERSYAGATLATFERNGYDDSDFYAVVWDEAIGVVRSVQYATTRGWTYDNSVSIDATDEVKAKARVWLKGWWLDTMGLQEAWRAAEPTVGKAVEFVRGRKVPVGSRGEVFWYGDGRQYDAWSARYAKPPKRVGVVLENGERVFSAAENVKVTDAADWVASLADLKERAERKAAEESWITPVHPLTAMALVGL